MKRNTDLVNIILLAHSLPLFPTLTLVRNRHFRSFPSSGKDRNNTARPWLLQLTKLAYPITETTATTKAKVQGNRSCLTNETKRDFINVRHSVWVESGLRILSGEAEVMMSGQIWLRLCHVLLFGFGPWLLTFLYFVCMHGMDRNSAMRKMNVNQRQKWLNNVYFPCNWLIRIIIT